jgi:hypothetical protein
MRAEAFPIIRIEIDHMKHQIASMLGIKGSDLELAINEEIEKQMAIFARETLPTMVRETLHEAVEAELKSYFKFGDGATAIQDAVKNNFKID